MDDFDDAVAQIEDVEPAKPQVGDEVVDIVSKDRPGHDGVPLRGTEAKSRLLNSANNPSTRSTSLPPFYRLAMAARHSRYFGMGAWFSNRLAQTLPSPATAACAWGAIGFLAACEDATLKRSDGASLALSGTCAQLKACGDVVAALCGASILAIDAEAMSPVRRFSFEVPPSAVALHSGGVLCFSFSDGELHFREIAKEEEQSPSSSQRTYAQDDIVSLEQQTRLTPLPAILREETTCVGVVEYTDSFASWRPLKPLDPYGEEIAAAAAAPKELVFSLELKVASVGMSLEMTSTDHPLGKVQVDALHLGRVSKNIVDASLSSEKKYTFDLRGAIVSRLVIRTSAASSVRFCVLGVAHSSSAAAAAGAAAWRSIRSDDVRGLLENVAASDVPARVKLPALRLLIRARFFQIGDIPTFLEKNFVDATSPAVPHAAAELLIRSVEKTSKAPPPPRGNDALERVRWRAHARGSRGVRRYHLTFVEVSAVCCAASRRVECVLPRA